MRVLKIQDAQKLLRKILSHPKNYELKHVEGEIIGKDEEISFRFYKGKNDDRATFEVTIDSFIFANSTGEWSNAMIMLENALKKIEREDEEEKIAEALNKLKRYLSTED